MGNRKTLGTVCGVTFYHVTYRYQPGYYEAKGLDGKVLTKEENPTGFMAAIIKALE